MKPSQFSLCPAPDAAMRFYHQETDDLLRVENTHDGNILIHSAKGHLPLQQRQNFVRYLKLEGFIPARVSRVVWAFDPCWPHAEPGFNRYSRRRCWRLVLGLSLGWSLLMGWLVFR